MQSPSSLAGEGGGKGEIIKAYSDEKIREKIAWSCRRKDVRRNSLGRLPSARKLLPRGERKFPGKEGKPFYISGPHETQADSERIIATLTRKLGPDGFHYVLGGDRGRIIEEMDP